MRVHERGVPHAEVGQREEDVIAAHRGLRALQLAEKERDDLGSERRVVDGELAERENHVALQLLLSPPAAAPAQARPARGPRSA